MFLLKAAFLLVRGILAPSENSIYVEIGSSSI